MAAWRFADVLLFFLFSFCLCFFFFLWEETLQMDGLFSSLFVAELWNFVLMAAVLGVDRPAGSESKSLISFSLRFASSRHAVMFVADFISLVFIWPHLNSFLNPPPPRGSCWWQCPGRGASAPPPGFLRGPSFCGEIPHLVPIAACTPAAVGSV